MDRYTKPYLQTSGANAPLQYRDVHRCRRGHSMLHCGRNAADLLNTNSVQFSKWHHVLNVIAPIVRPRTQSDILNSH